MRSSSSLPVITDDDATEGPEGPETITWTWAVHSSSGTTDTATAIAIEGKLRF